MKTKIKFFGDEATDFHNKEMLKTGSNHTCLAVITIDSALKKEEKFYPQVFSKECKYIKKEVIKHFNMNFSVILMNPMKNKLVWVSFLEQKI